jgi:hypothetical protein
VLIDGRMIRRNPDVMLHQALADATLLYDPVTDGAYRLNPTGVLVWKHLDECAEMREMSAILSREHTGVPPDVSGEVEAFVSALGSRGLVATSEGNGHRRRGR